VADPSYALHVALLARLKALVSCDVWDSVPQNTNYPYVTMDSAQSVDDAYLQLRVTTHYVYLSIWSRQYGQAEVFEILGQLDAINETPLSLSTGHVASVRVERAHVASVRVERAHTVREADTLTFKGHMTLRIIIQHGE